MGKKMKADQGSLPGTENATPEVPDEVRRESIKLRRIRVKKAELMQQEKESLASLVEMIAGDKALSNGYRVEVDGEQVDFDPESFVKIKTKLVEEIE